MNDAYEILLRNKMQNESFSKVIRRAFEKKDIMSFAGSWKKISDKDIKKIKEDIENIDKKATKEAVKKAYDRY